MKGKKTGGREKGAANKSTIEIKQIIDNAVDFSVVIGKLLELVEGVTVAEIRGDELITYSKPPDSSAAKILLEYRFGKPQQSIELTGATKFKVTIKK